MSLHSRAITLVKRLWYQNVSRSDINLGIFARRGKDECSTVQDLGSTNSSGRDRNSCVDLSAKGVLIISRSWVHIPIG